MNDPLTVAEALAEAFRARGVGRIFGVPGGGASLDVIAAAAERGIDFVLAQTETSAAIMAATVAELTGVPGVVVTGVGPGAASAVNGVAYAALERAPLVIVTDAVEADDRQRTYQRIDQGAMFGALVKESHHLRESDGSGVIEALIDTGLAHPQGPVHIDLAAGEAGRAMRETPSLAAEPEPAAPSNRDVAAARALLDGARRPVLIAGLEAREDGTTGAVRALAVELACPQFTTYKAKGVFADGDARTIGLFTGAAVEADCVDQADLILCLGLDPVELIPQPWRYAAPVLAVSPVAGHRYPVEPTVRLVTPTARGVDLLDGAGGASAWEAAEMTRLKEDFRRRSTITTDGGRSAQAVVDAIIANLPAGARVTVDSGAHMFSALAFIDATEAGDVLTSNGLSTMAHALPAAIAAALVEPGRPAVALIGDGGLMMCLGELATAARLGLPVAVVVFNDAALSLIDVKQQMKGQPRRGVRYPPVDFAAVAEGLGCRAWRAGADDDVEAVLGQVFAAEGTVLVDVDVDPKGYGPQLESLRV